MPPTAPPAEPTAAEPPPTDEPILAPNEKPASRLGRILATIFIVGAVGFWLWLILLAPDQEPRDRLDDPAFAAAAAPICADAQAAVLELPAARQAQTPQERAVVLEDTTTIFQTMVDDLRTIAPETERDGDLVNRWLDDWQVYLGDRTDYASELAEGQDVPFQLTPLEGDAITEAVDGLADANDLESCTTPLDV